MKEVFKNLFVGNEQDFKDLEYWKLDSDFAVVHTCKEPFHRELLGYVGRGCPKDNPEYLWAERGDRLYLNMVDAPISLFFDKSMVDKALNFIEQKLNEGKKVLIHCNLGESRSPSIALLYLIKHGFIKGETLEDCEVAFLRLYPNYNPGKGIRDFVKEHFKEYQHGSC